MASRRRLARRGWWLLGTRRFLRGRRNFRPRGIPACDTGRSGLGTIRNSYGLQKKKLVVLETIKTDFAHQAAWTLPVAALANVCVFHRGRPIVDRNIAMVRAVFRGRRRCCRSIRLRSAGRAHSMCVPWVSRMIVGRWSANVSEAAAFEDFDLGSFRRPRFLQRRGAKALIVDQAVDGRRFRLRSPLLRLHD